MKYSSIDLTSARRVNPVRFSHPIPTRGFCVKSVDFTAFSENYEKPNYGATDSYGILINESQASDVGCGAVSLTRQYIDELPESWSEYGYIQISHDEFIETANSVKYYKYWSSRGPSKTPTPPDFGSLPEGASLLREIDIGIVTNAVKSFADLSGDEIQDLISSESHVKDWGGTWYIYSYPVDPATGANLTTQKRLAASNYGLNPALPSTCTIPVLTKIVHSYHILPDGPQESDFVLATQKVSTFGAATRGWPRNTSTILESAVFTQISGALYERVLRYWAQSEEVESS